MGWDYVIIKVINFIRGSTISDMPPDRKVRRQRKAIRFTYGIYAAFFPIAVLVLALIPETSFVPAPSAVLTSLPASEVILGGFSIISLALGFFWPWLAGWHEKTHVDDMELIYGHIIRGAFFIAPVLCGSLLRILGSGWYIVLPIFILPFTALILTFPTDKRLAKWQRGQKPSH